MSTCPQRGGPHELSQCPRWRVPAILLALLLAGCASAPDSNRCRKGSL